MCWGLAQEVLAGVSWQLAGKTWEVSSVECGMSWALAWKLLWVASVVDVGGCGVLAGVQV